MQYIMYYNVCMKISKTFRLSEEAVNVLNEQTNATEFLEALILDNYQRPLEVVPLSQVKDLLEERLGSLQPAVSPPPVIGVPTPEKIQRVSPTANKRDKSTIKAEIDQLEDERRSELEYVQDPDTAHQVHKEFQERIDSLWREFNEQNRQA